jgi:hypothetical protein
VSHSDESAVAPHRKPPLPTLGLVILLIIFGLALVFQSRRWSHTPAYGNLLQIFHAPIWGFVYLGAATLLLVGLLLEVRSVNIAGHTLAFILLATWELAFFVRWVTDPFTTIANVVAWGYYLSLLMRSANKLRKPALPPIS